MRHDTKLNLRIIGGQQKLIAGSDKRLTNTTTFGCAYRNILQIRVGR